MRLPPELTDFESALAPNPSVPTELVCPTVYSLLIPETKAATEELWAAAPHLLYERAFDGGQEELPALMLDTWRRWSGMTLGNAFPHEYVTAGASEAIKDLIVPGNRIHCFKGDYEGYRHIALARGVPYFEHERQVIFGDELLPGDQFFVTDPSSIDGEQWSDLDGWLEWMNEQLPEVRIVIDSVYVGAVHRYSPRNFERHPNVAAVILSLSKPFGIYYHRAGGVISRRVIPSLIGNKWFYNPFSIALATLLMRRYPVDEIPRRYAELQRRALESAIRAREVPESAVPSNVFLLAKAAEGQKEFRRTDRVYRFCLTPRMYEELYPSARP